MATWLMALSVIAAGAVYAYMLLRVREKRDVLSECIVICIAIITFNIGLALAPHPGFLRCSTDKDCMGMAYFIGIMAVVPVSTVWYVIFITLKMLAIAPHKKLNRRTRG